MAKLLRVDRPSLWYHLTARGNEQRLTSRDDRDREHFLELLAQWAEQVRRRLHAYVLMANHGGVNFEQSTFDLTGDRRG